MSESATNQIPVLAPPDIVKVLRDLRTSLNAGGMSQLSTVPVRLGALRTLLEWADPVNGQKPGEALVGEKNGQIIIDFQAPLNWVQFTPEQAEQFARTILNRVEQLRAATRADDWPCTFSHHQHATRDEAVECARTRR